VEPEIPVVLDARVVTGAGGGPDKTILNSPRFLEPLGYRMLCAYLHPPADPGFERLRSRARACGAPLLAVPDRGPFDLAVLPRLLRICREERVAIWHAHDYKSNLIGLLLRPYWPMRLVTTVHGWVQRTWKTPLYYAVDRFSLPRYERVLCVSPDLHRTCSRYGVPASRCLLVENGIDLEQFSRQAPLAEAKLRLGVDPDRPLLGAVGRLSAEKGFDLLIRAADRLLRGGLDFELVIAGDGDQRLELEDLITRLGRRDRIRLLGYCDETAALYEALDGFVLSSRREGLPNVLLEAMAMEVPVIATRVAGIPRLIVDGEDGILVEPGSLDELAGAIARLLRDPGLRRRLGRSGRATIEQRYSFRERMRKIGGLYDEILRPHADAPAPCEASLS
jgi:glycosyltransferase involved in cell wall biosynthesis